jgi:hypothetical protein
VREAVRVDALALDQARIAEGGFLPGTALVDQEHGATALLQMNGNRHADDAGPENNHILTHGKPKPHFCGLSRVRAEGLHAPVAWWHLYL